MMTFIFIFTFTMVVVASVKYFGMLFNVSVSLPKIVPGTAIDPGYYYVFYPSIMYQAYFWFERAGVLV